ncbi:hypothetical protein [Pseudomonas aeruginosa]|jgi:hypothetical protein|uniref:hypothetical protein n=1 Tax=Pseudomonas aeruginosa TaxID=287 RepID=UPI001ADA1EE3|nr:hypothetical protein [Pseudomonas aeruginosa]MBO8337153.1 hypothetical protein [Pseudomonas aeruginosa]MCV6455316.1 hypothetical protein [Pseudomonas aeruginosa]HBO6962792.1 hypothetical protein [Pseudomonas aeruginosa]HBO7218603.1 hypothetical protein [Pseudomonas aeruginosa]HCF4080819.1 hypothetical protein [Pseudomonas aeruginosa]
MTLKDLFWNLTRVGDCSVLDEQTRDAAKASQLALSEVRNLLDLPATATASELVAAVRQLKAGA